MYMQFWGRALLLGGLVAAMLSSTPALILALLPPGFSDGFLGVLAALLTLTVTPLGVLAASVGGILLLVAAVRGGRS